MKAVAQHHAFAALLPFARRHRLMGDKQIMQPSRPGQTGIVGGIEHAGGIAQKTLGVIQRQRLHKVFRREAGPAAEQVMQFVGRQMCRVRHRLDGRLRAPLFGDEPDRAAHGVVVAQRRALFGRTRKMQVVEGEFFHRVGHHGGIRYAVSIMI